MHPKFIDMLFSYITRIAISVLIFGLAIYQFIDGEIGNGIFITLIAGLVLATVWVNEVMLMAFLAVRKNDMAKTQKWLGYITKPELLIKSQEAYYFYLTAIVKAQTGEMGKSENLFKKALSIGLAMSHDRAMAKVNLAGIAASKRRKREALNWLNEAKKDDEKKMLNDQIKMMRQQINRM